MRQIKKRLWLMVCVALSLLVLSACSAETENAVSDPQLAQILCNSAEADLDAFNMIKEEDLDQVEANAIKSKDNAVAGGISSWKSMLPETGKLVKILSSRALETEDGYECIVAAEFEKRQVEFKAFYEESNGMLAAVSYSFTPEYTTGEKLAKAAMNTAMGMGTVFLVLIFISVLISCFKFINAWENSRKASQAPAAAPAPVAVVAAEEEEDLTDDLELVAVITAAVAAYDNTVSTDGLVVRSIKRASGAKWKRA